MMMMMNNTGKSAHFRHVAVKSALCRYRLHCPHCAITGIPTSHFSQFTVSMAEQKKTFFSSGRRLKPMTFSLEHDLDIAEKNRHAKYAGQRSLRSNIIVRTQTDTHRANFSICATNV